MTTTDETQNPNRFDPGLEAQVAALRDQRNAAQDEAALWKAAAMEERQKALALVAQLQKDQEGAQAAQGAPEDPAPLPTVPARPRKAQGGPQ